MDKCDYYVEAKDWIETPFDGVHTPTKRFKCPWCGKRTGYRQAYNWKYCPYCVNPVKYPENN